MEIANQKFTNFKAFIKQHLNDEELSHQRLKQFMKIPLGVFIMGIKQKGVNDYNILLREVLQELNINRGFAVEVKNKLCLYIEYFIEVSKC